MQRHRCSSWKWKQKMTFCDWYTQTPASYFIFFFQLVVFQICNPFCYACGSGTCPFRGDWVSVPTLRRAYSTSVQLASLSLGIGHWANDRNGKCTHTASVREDHFEGDSGELPGVSCHQATLPSHFRLPVAHWLCRLGSN